MDAIKYLLLFFLETNNLTYYERRHFKLFTNCHVSWDTLYATEHCAMHSMELDKITNFEVE